MSDAPVFDFAGAMERVENDKALYFELIDILNQQFAETMQQIFLEIKNQNATSLNSTAHSIKSALGNVGAMRCYNLAYQLERCGKENKLESAGELLEQLKVEFQLFSVEVSKVAR